MKIVYCIAGTFNSGGMERVLAIKANWLVNHGHEVHVITTDQCGRAPYFLMDARIIQHDLNILYDTTVPKNLVGKLLTYPSKQIAHRKKLAILLKQLKADVVISMFDHEASFLYKIDDGSMKVLEIHFSRFKRQQYGRKGIWGWINRMRSQQDLAIAKRYDRFVVLTEEDRGYWGALPNIAVIANPNSYESLLRADISSKQAIAVGRLDYQKGFEELILIWKEVHRLQPDWKLNIFGSGPLKEALEQLIRNDGLQDVVRIQPPVKDIAQVYVQHSILLMTSRYEGLPMVLLEGQIHGLPMVAYACKCGPRDIIQQGVNGWLIEEADRRTFGEKVVALMTDENSRSRMGEQAKAMSSRFSEGEIMQKWLNLFNGMLG